MNLKVLINEEYEYEVVKEDKSVLINSSPSSYSIKTLGLNQYLLNFNNRLYDIFVKERNMHSLSINVNGQDLELSVKDHITQMLEKLGMDLHQINEVDGVNAPMPGTILKIAVKEGDQVKSGDTLLILEAMKMENVIKSPVDAEVTSILIKEGQTVEKNTRLLSF